MFIGPEIDKAAAYNASKVNVKISSNEEIQQFDGKHPNLNTYKPVHWLIDTMSQAGVNFKKGQAIITGSYAGLVALEFHKTYQIEYAGLSSYPITFEPR